MLRFLKETHSQNFRQLKGQKVNMRIMLWKIVAHYHYGVYTLAGRGQCFHAALEWLLRLEWPIRYNSYILPGYEHNRIIQEIKPIMNWS